MCDAVDCVAPQFVDWTDRLTDRQRQQFRRGSPLVDKLVRAEVVSAGCVLRLDTEGGKVQPICQSGAQQGGQNDRNITHRHVGGSACLSFTLAEMRKSNPSKAVPS